ncbi:chromatin assembly factor 1 subunit rlf2 [Plutella xylostella]|uniref:chromatin assembly factor 1 subunit rlf2 n=1 Tax=Plutella xylostella TaxID=51655 RepID=UPI0005D0BC09|nr:chromatin assembly factor 1 subunit rlf2 [Plutella xylostella]
MSKNDEERRTRGPNFSLSDKKKLLNLIAKYKDVVEDKNTDGETNVKKNKVWSKLTDEFNSKSSCSVRNTRQLKKLWEKMKTNTRKGRGGTNPFQGQVEIILGTTLSGIKDPLDSDVNLVLNNVLANEENESGQSEVSNTETSVVDQCFIGAENETGPSQMYQDDITREDECMTNVSDASCDVSRKKHSPTWLQRKRPNTYLEYKILEHKLELAKIFKKNAESQGKMKYKIQEEQLKNTESEGKMKYKIQEEQIKNAESEWKMKYKIQEEQLKQEKINTEILKLKLKAAQNELLNKNN